jgi:hypothetical protein
VAAARLDELLSPDQVRLLAAYLLVAVEYGHGQVEIRITQGEPKFIGLHLEEVFNRSVTRSRLAELLCDSK